MKRRTTTTAPAIPLVLDLVDVPGIDRSAASDRLRVAMYEMLIHRAELWVTEPRAAAQLDAELLRRLLPTPGGVA